MRHYLAVKIDRAALPRTKNHLTMDKYADWLLLYGNILNGFVISCKNYVIHSFFITYNYLFQSMVHEIIYPK